MKMYARLTDGQIGLMLTDEEYKANEKWYSTQNMQYVDVPEDFDFTDMMNYTIVDGEITYSPRPLTDFEKESRKAEKREKQFYKAVQKLIAKVGFTADEALEFGYLYPGWGAEDAKYKKGELYVYEDSVYCCLKNNQQKHGIEITDPDYWELVGPIE